MYKLTLVALLFFLPGSAQAQLPGIIGEFCADIEVLATNALQEVTEATADLQDCSVELDDCLSGLFGGGPVECIQDYSRCTNRQNGEQRQACNEFVREFSAATRQALRRARGEGVEAGFRLFLVSDEGQECVEPAENIAGLCAGLASD